MIFISKIKNYIFYKSTYKQLFLVGLYDESNEGGKRFLVRGGALVAIPGVYKNSADVALYVKNKPDNWAATLKYSTMGQDEERFFDFLLRT